MISYTYACKEYPGMETCPGRFEAETEDELWQHVELHSVLAHQDDPTAWSPEERAQVQALIRKVEKQG